LAGEFNRSAYVCEYRQQHDIMQRMRYELKSLKRNEIHVPDTQKIEKLEGGCREPE
jgi:hypothetical protein